MGKTIHKPTNFGWLRDRPDFRDRKYHEHKLAADRKRTLPKIVDHRGKNMPIIFDQGETSSCTAQAISPLLQFGRRIHKMPDMAPSRLFMYYNTRVIENSVEFDNGAEIRDVIKTLSNDGYVSEDSWPFQEEKIFEQPPRALYNVALRNRIADYYRIHNERLEDIKSCLAAGHLVVFGFSVYSSFYEADSNGGYVPYPNVNNDESLGGHAVLLVGYDDTKKVFIVRNSWGLESGDKGYYYMQYKHINNPELCNDFWTIRTADRDPKSN